MALFFRLCLFHLADCIPSPTCAIHLIQGGKTLAVWVLTSNSLSTHVQHASIAWCAILRAICPAYWMPNTSVRSSRTRRYLLKTRATSVGRGWSKDTLCFLCAIPFSGAR